MRDPIYNDDFENYLQNQVNKHRIYPSDNIWRNIQQEIHGYGKWPALTAITIFVISALVVGTFLVKPQAPRMLVANIAISAPQAAITRESINKQSSEVLVEHLSVEHITQQTIDAANEKLEPQNELVAYITPVAKNLNSTNTGVMSLAAAQQEKNSTSKISDIKMDGFATRFASTQASDKKTKIKPLFPIFPFDIIASSVSSEKNNFENSIPELNFPAEQKNSSYGNNAYTVKLNKSILTKLDFQFYLTPSISYRRLHDNVNGKLSQSYITALPFAANYAVDVNQVVRHKPAMGYEVGFQLGYKLSNRLSLRSGFQFNMQQYDIEAYMYKTGSSSAAPLGDAPASGVNTNTFTNFRNAPASSPFTLKNRYYEISLPVGIDWRPVGNGKISWGIAASVQPTYTFDKQPFVITSNYKDYADGSQLMHNWNVNTNVETYIGYQTGKFRWQAGPQFRYQLLPTLSNKYPIKENLMDYGFKIGFVKSLK